MRIRSLALVGLLLGMPLLGMAQPGVDPITQRVVISDGYTSWLLKGDDADDARYGEGEALPRLLADGWTIGHVSTGCGAKAQTVYVLHAPEPPLPKPPAAPTRR